MKNGISVAENITYAENTNNSHSVSNVFHGEGLGLLYDVGHLYDDDYSERMIKIYIRIAWTVIRYDKKKHIIMTYRQTICSACKKFKWVHLQ